MHRDGMSGLRSHNQLAGERHEPGFLVIRSASIMPICLWNPRSPLQLRSISIEIRIPHNQIIPVLCKKVHFFKSFLHSLVNTNLKQPAIMIKEKNEVFTWKSGRWVPLPPWWWSAPDRTPRGLWGHSATGSRCCPARPGLLLGALD